MTNAEKITLIRQIMNVEIAGFARILGVTERTVNSWENADSIPTKNVLHTAEAYLNREQTIEYWEKTDELHLHK